jgi:hypothetical protein
VTGRVTDATTGVGLAGVQMQLWLANDSNPTQTANTAADGSYQLAGAPAGTYYVAARSVDHQDMAYPAAPCSDFDPYQLSSCALSSAETITLTFGGGDVTGIDLALPLNAAIEGTIRFRVNGGIGGDVGNAAVGVYDSSGVSLVYALGDAQGHYALGDLPPGTYYLEGAAVSYFSEIYSGIDCPLLGSNCNPTVGTPVVLAQGQTVSDLDFDLVAASSVVGRVTDAQSGVGVAGVAIDTWNSTDDTHCGATATDADGYYVAGDSLVFCNGPARKVSTDAGRGYIDQVFDGITCPNGPAYLGLCPLDTATLLTIPAPAPQPVEADFVLQRGDAIFANGFE